MLVDQLLESRDALGDVGVSRLHVVPRDGGFFVEDALREDPEGATDRRELVEDILDVLLELQLRASLVDPPRRAVDDLGRRLAGIAGAAVEQFARRAVNAPRGLED